MRKIRAILLFSGGLDSLIVAKILEEQGIVIKALNFKTPFFGGEEAVKIGKHYGIDVEVYDIGREYIENVLLKPKYGYGKNMNPCIDCHRFFIKKAKERLDRGEADFIATGEVLGERPFSQNIEALSIVEEPARGYVLRPLSALLLKPTIPELRGWVDRTKLYGLRGRSRRPHFELAKKYGIDKIPSPAGGCLLTDPDFSFRLKDLLSKGEEVSTVRMELLKVGRHFVTDGGRLIISRNEKEKRFIERVQKKIENSRLLRADEEFVALLYGNFDVELAIRIVSAYMRNRSANIEVISSQERKVVKPLRNVSKADVRGFMLLR